MVTATAATRKTSSTTSTRATTSPANAGATAHSTLGTKMRTRPAKRGRTAIGNSNGNGSANVGSGSQPAPANRPCNATLELMAQQWEAAKATAKLHYTEADRIEQELIAAVGVGGLLPLSDGRTLRVKDNFRDAAGNQKIKAYSMAGVKLCEVEVK